MAALERAIRAISAGALQLAAAACLICFVLMCYSVAMRYFFGAPQSWIDYAVGWLVVAMVMFAAPAAQLTGNVGVGRAFILNPAGDPASPLLGQWADIPIERIGSERITVPAGSFDTQHFRLAGASDYWVTGDDWMVVKAKVRDAAYVLVSMS